MSIRKRGDRYQVRIRLGNGQRIERTLPANSSIADARSLEAALSSARIDAAIGRAPRYLIDQALDRWVESSAQSLRSWRSDLRYRVDVLRTYTAGLPLEALPDVADRIKKAGLAAELAPATINRMLAIVRRLGNLAERWGWTDKPLGRRIEMVPGERPREAYLTPEQVRAIADAAEPLTRDFILLAALTGLRRSEILRLTPESVRAGALVVDARSKSGRTRIVPMPAEAARIAQERLPFEIGVPLLTKRFRAAREAAGLPGVRLHDLRHAFGTWLAEARTDAPTIRDLMGHSSLTVTSRYLQAASATAKAAVRRLPKLGGVRVGSGGKGKRARKAA